MEYVFGNRERDGVVEEILKTKNDTHTDLSGSMTIQRDYTDRIIFDSFVVSRKYQSKIDEEGNCYDWYIITNHYRYIDSYTPNIGEVEERLDSDIIDLSNGLMETYETMSENANEIVDINNALIELYEMIAEVK